MQNRMKLANLLGLAAVAGAMAVGATSAGAQVQLTDGNFGGGATGNVLVAADINTAVAHIDANLNGAPASLDGFVNVDSTKDLLTAQGQGQATFVPKDGVLNEISFSLDNDPGNLKPYYFTAFSLNPEGVSVDPKKVSSPYRVIVDYIDTALVLHQITFDPAGMLGKGNNRFGVQADPGFALVKVTFQSGNDTFGSDDAKQARIIGYTQTVPPTGGQVPEPGSLAMCAGVVVPVLGLIRRKRQA